MQAVLYGGGEKNPIRKWNTNQAKPTLKTQTQVLVKTHAAGINPIDYKLPVLFCKNSVYGLDFSGVIEEIGTNVKDFQVGDKVYGVSRAGTLADYTNPESASIAKMPENYSFVEAAALGTTYTTSYQSLIRNGFKGGDKVLIIGASGGTGTAAVWLAAQMKAGEVVAVCSGKNSELVTSLGATRVIDYTKEKYVDVFPEGYFDLVYDCASGSGKGEWYFDDTWKVLKKDGMSVSINGSMWMWARRFLGLEGSRHKTMLADACTTDFNMMNDLIKADNHKPVMHKVYQFTEDEVNAAYDELAGRRARGKICISMVE